MRLMVSLLVVLVWFGTPVTWANHDGQEDICHSAAVIFCENWAGTVIPAIDALDSVKPSPVETLTFVPIP